MSPNSPHVTVRSGEEADATRGTPGTTQEDSSKIPHTDEMADGTDTDHYMQPDADNSVEQINPTPAAQNMIYAITLSQIATTTTDFKS